MNKVAKNFLFVSVSNLLAQVMVFFTGTHYAKIIGKSAFGDITTVQAIMTYLTMFVLFGLQTYGTREIAKDKDNTPYIVGDTFAFRAILIILVAIIIFFIYELFGINEKNSSLRVLLLVYGITLIPAGMNIDWVYNGIQEMKYNAVYNIIKNIIPFILIYVFLKSKSQIYYIPLFTFIALVLGSVYQLYIYFLKLKFKLKINLNREKVNNYVNFGFPFLVSGILAMINGNVDKIIIEFTRGNTEAGIYSSAYYIINFLMNVETMIFTVVFPLFISYYNNKDTKSLNKIVDKTSKIIIAVVMPLVLGGLILSKDIMLIFFGESYAEAYAPFSILLIYILILFIREIYGYGLNAWNMEKKYLKAVTVSSFFNLIMNLILTPVYGMNVAAFITVISEVINLYLMRKYSSSVVKVSSLKYILRILIPCIAMCIVTVELKIFMVNAIINIIASALVYLASVFLFKYITLDEIKDFLLRKNGV
ncbi:teichoic acid transporter [Clostridium sp. DMHC 10]|uniref:flippase n=1 Tax=Clostridium sp. DMHC 10 TaxID=747377 RepID=UPI00069FCA56|nr:flippase [Clostridium sp. DMHC 10]KOF55952.1 teichoic acid transporter [Clostridium sp. DMHC 10]